MASNPTTVSKIGFLDLHRVRPHESPGSFASLVALVIIFAGFVCYQIAVNEQWIYPILGGFFTAGCAIGLLLIAIPYGRLLIHTGIGREPAGWILFAFLALYGITVFVNEPHTDPLITISHASYWFKWYVFFLLSRMLDPTYQRFRTWTLAATVLIIGCIVSRASDGELTTSETAQIINDGFGLDYQGIGHALLVVATCTAVVQTRATRLVLYFLTLVGLFYSGARSELVAFLLSAGLIELCYARKASVMPLFVTLLLTLAFAFGIVNTIELPDHRVFNLLRLSADDSARERVEGISRAFETIYNNPLIGDYASYINGHYAHNIISVWVDLGLTGLVLMVLILFYPTWMLTRKFRQCRNDPLYTLTICMFATSIMLLLFAKQFTYQTIPIGVGLYCQWRFAQARRRIFRHRYSH